MDQKTKVNRILKHCSWISSLQILRTIGHLMNCSLVCPAAEAFLNGAVLDRSQTVHSRHFLEGSGEVLMAEMAVRMTEELLKPHA